MDQLIAQGVGYLALLFVILSFQKKTRTTLLLVMLAGLILFTIHYALIGAWTGSLMNLIEAAMVFVAYKKETQAWAQKISGSIVLSRCTQCAAFLRSKLGWIFSRFWRKQSVL